MIVNIARVLTSSTFSLTVVSHTTLREFAWSHVEN